MSLPAVNDLRPRTSVYAPPWTNRLSEHCSSIFFHRLECDQGASHLGNSSFIRVVIAAAAAAAITTSSDNPSAQPRMLLAGWTYMGSWASTLTRGTCARRESFARISAFRGTGIVNRLSIYSEHERSHGRPSSIFTPRALGHHLPILRVEAGQPQTINLSRAAPHSCAKMAVSVRLTECPRDTHSSFLRLMGWRGGGAVPRHRRYIDKHHKARACICGDEKRCEGQPDAFSFNFRDWPITQTARIVVQTEHDTVSANIFCLARPKPKP